MMYACQLCGNFASATYRSVLGHIRAVHAHEAGFTVQCGIHSCPRTFKNYHSFRRRIRKKHPHLQLQEPLEAAAENPVPSDDDEEPFPEDTSQPLAEVHVGDSGGSSSNMSLKDQAVKILKLKEKYKLAQTTVDDIISDTREITSSVILKLQQKATPLLSQYGVSPDEISELFTDQDLVPFGALQTRYLQEQYFRAELGLVVSYY